MVGVEFEKKEKSYIFSQPPLISLIITLKCGSKNKNTIEDRPTMDIWDDTSTDILTNLKKFGLHIKNVGVKGRQADTDTQTDTLTDLIGL